MKLRPGEYGFLLLTSCLGNPERKPLTTAQFRRLWQRWEQLDFRDASREIRPEDFVSIGYGRDAARHIFALLQEEELLHRYLSRAESQGIRPITRATEAYPLLLRRRLGADAPGVLWARGDFSVLGAPAVSLVGSRELRQANRMFAEEAGRQAALQGLTLVSGNARGADRTAQAACLEAGGRVISVVADSLLEHRERENLLCLSEDGFDDAFSAQRALRRNRVIHGLGRITFVAQADLGKGGTWDGTTKNLRFGWSPVVCFRDGSPAAEELEQRGAYGIGREDLKDFCALQKEEITLFDMGEDNGYP